MNLLNIWFLIVATVLRDQVARCSGITVGEGESGNKVIKVAPAWNRRDGWAIEMVR
jgi:hypothetical protein